MRYTTPVPKPVKREKEPKRLQRSKPMRRGKGKTKHARRERHIDHMLEVKKLSCRACACFGWDRRCQRNEDGENEAAHVGPRKGYRAPDLNTIPLGAYHHRINGWDTYSGPFDGWSRAERRDWADMQITWTRAAVAARTVPSGTSTGVSE